jgi:type IV pilus assembly protein PilB
VVDEILSNAVDNGISDIHFEIFRNNADVRFRKNGTLFVVDAYLKFISENYNAVISRIKILSQLFC